MVLVAINQEFGGLASLFFGFYQYVFLNFLFLLKFKGSKKGS